MVISESSIILERSGNPLGEQPMSHLTTHKHRKSSYLHAYKAPVFCLLFSVFCHLHLSRTLYKSALFMQNKPNFRKPKMNLSFYSTRDYENISDWTLSQNKPNPSGLRCLLRSCRTDQTQSRNSYRAPMLEIGFGCRDNLLDLGVLI